MQDNTKQKRIKYTEQIAIFLTPDERLLLEKVRDLLRGTYSQVFRLALVKFADQLVESGILEEKERCQKTTS